MTYILFFHRLFDRKVTWSNPHSAGEELNLNYQGKSYNKHISNKCFREIPRSCLTVLFFIKIFIKRSILCSKYCCGIMVVVFFCSFMQLSSYPSNHNQNAHFFLSPSHTFSILLQFLSFLPFFLFSLSLFSGTIRCSKLVLYFSASLTYLPISLKNHSFFPWDSIQKPDSGCYLRKLSFKKQYM